jgi:hypothetical protein
MENDDQTMMEQPRTMEDLLKRIHDEASAIDRLIDPLTDEKLTQPDSGGWSVKDNLAHLNEWNRYLLLAIFQHQPAYQVFGIDKKEIQGMGEDEINAATFRKNKDLPSDQVIHQLRESIEKVNETLQKMDFQDLLQPRYVDDPEQRPRLQWVIGNTYGHYREHRLRIQEHIARLNSMR